MTRRKNTKRFDPRYFLNERLDVEALAQQVADEPGVEKAVMALPQEFDEKTSKPLSGNKIEFLIPIIQQTEPYTSGEAGWIPGEVEAVAKAALGIIFDRNREF